MTKKFKVMLYSSLLLASLSTAPLISQSIVYADANNSKLANLPTETGHVLNASYYIKNNGKTEALETYINTPDKDGIIAANRLKPDLPEGIKLINASLPLDKDYKVPTDKAVSQLIYNTDYEYPLETKATGQTVKINYVGNNDEIVHTQTLSDKNGLSQVMKYELPKGYHYTSLSFNKQDTQDTLSMYYYLHDSVFKFRTKNPTITIPVTKDLHDKPAGANSKKVTIHYLDYKTHTELKTQTLYGNPDQEIEMNWLYPIMDLHNSNYIQRGSSAYYAPKDQYLNNIDNPAFNIYEQYTFPSLKEKDQDIYVSLVGKDVENEVKNKQAEPNQAEPNKDNTGTLQTQVFNKNNTGKNADQKGEQNTKKTNSKQNSKKKNKAAKNKKRYQDRLANHQRQNSMNGNNSQTKADRSPNRTNNGHSVNTQNNRQQHLPQTNEKAGVGILGAILVVLSFGLWKNINKVSPKKH